MVDELLALPNWEQRMSLVLKLIAGVASKGNGVLSRIFPESLTATADMGVLLEIQWVDSNLYAPLCKGASAVSSAERGRGDLVSI